GRADSHFRVKSRSHPIITPRCSSAGARARLLNMTVLLRPVQLQRQPVHRIGDVAPLRKPAPWKAERQVGTVDAAVAQAHTGGRGIARTAGAEAWCRR